MKIQFELNGKTVKVDVPEDTPLLWTIRDHLGMTGTKFGCGIGMCGACTVHVNGRATRSCITPVSAVADSAVKTIEGVEPSHPLQQAWVKAQAPQCGYCQPGQIMQAMNLLEDFPEPSDEQINEVMSGNLCRCMAYLRIKEAIKLAAGEMKKEQADG